MICIDAGGDSVVKTEKWYVFMRRLGCSVERKTLHVHARSSFVLGYRVFLLPQLGLGAMQPPLVNNATFVKRAVALRVKYRVVDATGATSSHLAPFCSSSTSSRPQRRAPKRPALRGVVPTGLLLVRL